MQITEIVVSAGRTFNHPYEDYSNLRPSVTLKATLTEGDDPEEETNRLQAKAEKLVEDHKQSLIKSLHELYQMSVTQAELQSLEDSLKRAQDRIKELREKNPKLLENNTDIPY